MSACPQYEPLLLDEAAGELPPAEAARLQAHRQACRRCREEGAAYAEVLSLVRLPPPDAAERARLDGLAAATAHALGRRAAARTGLGVGAALAACAAAALLLASGRPPAPAPPQREAPTAAARWEPPDPEALWRDADLFEDDASSSPPSSAALAALED